MTKPARDEAATKDAWIQERLGERKYRQLRMHLSGALRLLGELATVPGQGLSKKPTDPEATDLKVETTKAMAVLSERLRRGAGFCGLGGTLDGGPISASTRSVSFESLSHLDGGHRHTWRKEVFPPAFDLVTQRRIERFCCDGRFQF
jgi:hypothetical protein